MSNRFKEAQGASVEGTAPQQIPKKKGEQVKAGGVEKPNKERQQREMRFPRLDLFSYPLPRRAFFRLCGAIVMRTEETCIRIYSVGMRPSLLSRRAAGSTHAGRKEKKKKKRKKESLIKTFRAPIPRRRRHSAKMGW